MRTKFAYMMEQYLKKKEPEKIDKNYELKKAIEDAEREIDEYFEKIFGLIEELDQKFQLDLESGDLKEIKRDLLEEVGRNL